MQTQLEMENDMGLDSDKLPITAEVYNMVKEQIVTLKILPGQLLMVQQLSKEYGISRTPVREALIRLKEEGLINQADGRKFQVSYITWKLIKDIFQARESVEKTSIEYAAMNYNKKMEKSLDNIMERMEKSFHDNAYEEYFKVDAELHSWMLQTLGNSVIMNWMERISDQQQRIRYATMGISTSMDVSIGEHRKMVEAIKSNDVDTARKEMHNHLKRALQDILKLKERANPYLTTFIQD